MEDERYVYGACCTWAGFIHEVADNGGLPSCPYCKGILFELESKKNWDDSIIEFEKTHPNYSKIWTWQTEQKKCFKDIHELVASFNLATGMDVSL